MSHLQQKLEEQKKIIDFLASKYEKDTGRKIQMPTTLGQLLGDDSIIGEEKKEDKSGKDRQTFGEAIEVLKLPKGEPPKKGEKKKKEISVLPHHMLEKIDLSGFRHKRFSRSALKELLEGVSLLPCIRAVSLRDNGITDDYDREVLELFSITKVKCIDLSKNNMQKLGGMIGKKLKEECTHIQWLDLTQNDFFFDSIANGAIIHGLKRQTNLLYVGLTVIPPLKPPEIPPKNAPMKSSEIFSYETSLKSPDNKRKEIEKPA